jgi:hypothetical protein
MTSLKDQQKLLKDAGKGVEDSGQYKFLVEGKTLTETLLKPEMKKLFKGLKSGAKKIVEKYKNK